MTATRRVRTALAVVATAVGFLASPSGQGVSAPTGTVLGRVVESGSDRGVAGALVRLNADGLAPTAPRPGATTSDRPTVITDASGAFLFRDVPTGRYAVTAYAAGFIPAAYGQSDPDEPARLLRVRSDKPGPALTIEASRYGVIGGTVRDESGDPAVGVAVRALRRTFTGGRFQYEPSAEGTTDDRGAYRFWQLLPGAYVVVAPSTTTSMDATTATNLAAEMMRIGSSGGVGAIQSPTVSAMMAAGALLVPQGLRVGNQLIAVPLQPSQASAIAPLPAAAGPIQVYSSTFHPATNTLAAASIIEVESGEERAGIDLTLALALGHRVAGRLLPPDGMAGQFVIRLMPQGAEAITTDVDFETAVAMSRADGAFTLFSVPSGSYHLKVLRPGAQVQPAVGVTQADRTLWADLPLTVSDADVTGLVVPLEHGTRANGRLAFVGEPALTAIEMSRTEVSLLPVDRRVLGRLAPPGGRPSSMGAFSTPEYPPGRYRLTVRSPRSDWLVRSVVVGGRDVADGVVDLDGGSNIDGLVVTLTNRLSTISGVVRDAGAGGALVLVMPADTSGWFEAGAPPDRIHRVWTDEDGTFRVGSLLGGQYLVSACDADTRVDISDPTGIRRLARLAMAVSVDEGAERTISLTVVTP